MSNDKYAIVSKCRGFIDGDVIPSHVMGSTGEEYMGREVVVFCPSESLFGVKRDMKFGRSRKLTLCNGILNQCSLRNPPTPYWAVVDAMSELKTGFTKSDVVNLAVRLLGEGKRRACEMAWDVLRNHHRHERKREAGMSYMVDILSDGKLSIRARSADETLQYFQAEASRKSMSRALLSGVKSGSVVPESSVEVSEEVTDQ